MSKVFNGGGGGARCDGCSAMVVDGWRILRRHRTMPTRSGPLHYCHGGCMALHVESERGMHRARTIDLSRESALLEVVGRLAPQMDSNLAFASAICGDLVRHLASVGVLLPADSGVHVAWVELFPRLSGGGDSLLANHGDHGQAVEHRSSLGGPLCPVCGELTRVDFLGDGREIRRCVGRLRRRDAVFVAGFNALSDERREACDLAGRHWAPWLSTVTACGLNAVDHAHDRERDEFIAFRGAGRCDTCLAAAERDAAAEIHGGSPFAAPGHDEPNVSPAEPPPAAIALLRSMALDLNARLPVGREQIKSANAGFPAALQKIIDALEGVANWVVAKSAPPPASGGDDRAPRYSCGPWCGECDAPAIAVLRGMAADLEAGRPLGTDAIRDAREGGPAALQEMLDALGRAAAALLCPTPEPATGCSGHWRRRPASPILDAAPAAGSVPPSDADAKARLDIREAIAVEMADNAALWMERQREPRSIEDVSAGRDGGLLAEEYSRAARLVREGEELPSGDADNPPDNARLACRLGIAAELQDVADSWKARDESSDPYAPIRASEYARAARCVGRDAGRMRAALRETTAPTCPPCRECGAEMRLTREDWPHPDLPGIVLRGVEFRRCVKDATHHEVALREMDGLHRSLALVIMSGRRSVTAEEVRFVENVFGADALSTFGLRLREEDAAEPVRAVLQFGRRGWERVEGEELDPRIPFLYLLDHRARHAIRRSQALGLPFRDLAAASADAWLRAKRARIARLSALVGRLEGEGAPSPEAAPFVDVGVRDEISRDDADALTHLREHRLPWQPLARRIARERIRLEEAELERMVTLLAEFGSV